MSGEFGLSQDGKVSTRCNDNTGPERYVVIEFDDMEENVQISMIKHLSQFLPLVLVLHSGGKSFHAWFNGCDASEDRVLAFRRHAASSVRTRPSSPGVKWFACLTNAGRRMVSFKSFIISIHRSHKRFRRSSIHQLRHVSFLYRKTIGGTERNKSPGSMSWWNLNRIANQSHRKSSKLIFAPRR